MLIGVNEQNQIKEINTIANESLTVIELDESADDYPFKNWSEAKILCYSYKNQEGHVSVYPYIGVEIIEKIEADNQKILQARADIDYLSIMLGVEL